MITGTLLLALKVVAVIAAAVLLFAAWITILLRRGVGWEFTFTTPAGRRLTCRVKFEHPIARFIAKWKQRLAEIVVQGLILVPGRKLSHRAFAHAFMHVIQDGEKQGAGGWEFEIYHLRDTANLGYGPQHPRERDAMIFAANPSDVFPDLELMEDGRLKVTYPGQAPYFRTKAA